MRVDEEIEAVVKTGGVIGITAIVSTLREANINSIVENVKYIGESFGWDYVALGTDFLGISQVPKGFENILKVRELVKAIEGHEEQLMWKNAYRVITQSLD
ncbi:hypothetical protein DJ531_12035 [Sulfolobus sp. A20-N-F6]|nr:hypothetical protein DJ531_12035 [Sulfolobus sp. A20-N-F6]